MARRWYSRTLPMASACARLVLRAAGGRPQRPRTDHSWAGLGQGTVRAYHLAGFCALTQEVYNKQMIKRQHGFTLIELITVIIILGILSAIALPKFIDLTNEALDAAVQGVAGSISSSSAIN